MKRLILSAIALSMLALPAVEAQAAPRQAQAVERYDAQWNKKPNHVVRKKVVVKKEVVVKKRWARGNRVPAWQRKQFVRDYGHYGLRRPGRGQQWVRVDNEFLLIGITSGVIAGLIAAH